MTCDPFCSPWCDPLLFCPSVRSVCKLTSEKVSLFLKSRSNYINNLFWRFTSMRVESSQVSVYSSGKPPSWNVKRGNAVTDPQGFWIHMCDIVSRTVTSDFLVFLIFCPQFTVPPEACATLQKHVLICELVMRDVRRTFTQQGKKKTTRLESTACKSEPSFDTVYLYEWKMHVASVLIRNLCTCLPPLSF